MINEPTKRSRTLLALEIAFVAFLGWIVLPSALPWSGSSARADIPAEQKLGGSKEQAKRFVPNEGPAVRLAAPQVGTPNACQTFDFAGGATQGFTVESTFATPQALWHVTNAACRAFLTGHSTPYTFYYGQDLSCNYNTGARNAANLISPPISIAGTFAPFSIGFNYLLFVEGGGFDTTFVDLSTNNGATWTQFLSKANLINDNQWHNIAADITALVGAATSVRLRFRFDSIDNIANSTTGWHVDDITVCGQPFNFCVQDDTTGDYIQFNSVTGAYVTKQCKTGFTTSGVGTVTTNGPVITLTQNSDQKFNSVTANTMSHTGSATIRVRNGFSIVAYNINDSNTLNNSCSCP